MQCDGTLSLRNWIFNMSDVIKRHSVVSLAKSLKFITESEYRLVYKCANGNLSS